ncbi:MAG: phosphatase PAP2 family protein [Candidatus Heimdallarchaeota archaeon]|nr:phosphatase PAP2 family protein [Candidatus Heimdallarchaeota archaeon]
MGWFFDQAIIEAFQNAAPWLKWPFLIITYFGEALIYIILLAIAFWIYKKKDAFIAIYILLTASFLNFFLKIIIRKPRPDHAIRLVEESNFSTPSGHAQTSATMYGWIMFYFKKIWLYIVIPILVILLCISRVFLGVHFIGDVIIGLLVGIAVLTAMYFGIPPLIRWIDTWSDKVKIIVGEIYGLVVFLITFLIGYFANWPPGDETNSSNFVAALLLFPMIIYIESKWIKMNNDNLHWSSKIFRVAVGLIVTIGFYFGFNELFDFIIETYSITNYGLVFLLDFIKYAIVFIVIGLLIPLLFVKVKYFSRKNEMELKEEKINLVKS